jgi:hypothetical protein
LDGFKNPDQQRSLLQPERNLDQLFLQPVLFFRLLDCLPPSFEYLLKVLSRGYLSIPIGDFLHSVTSLDAEAHRLIPSQKNSLRRLAVPDSPHLITYLAQCPNTSPFLLVCLQNVEAATDLDFLVPFDC